MDRDEIWRSMRSLAVPGAGLVVTQCIQPGAGTVPASVLGQKLTSCTAFDLVRMVPEADFQLRAVWP
jgi:hypothetical protein